MRTEIFINDCIHESRIAIVEDNALAEIWVERPENERMVGDVYKGTVTAVLPSLQAAFIDVGLERTAFLQVRDMVEAADLEEGGNSRNGRRPRHHPPIQELTKKGEQVLVQIAKEVLDGVKYRAAVRLDRDAVNRPQHVEIQGRHQGHH